jgi:hypothetical protein
MTIEQISQTTSAQRASRVGGFDIPCDAHTAFPLFSPEGEREWIKEWNPRPIFPDTITFVRDTVFRQGESEEEAVWTIVDVDWNTHRAEYVRVAPASHTAHIVVRVDDIRPGHSKAVVSYAITAFGTQANSLLEPFSEHSYAAKMRNWERQIRECLAARPGR